MRQTMLLIPMLLAGCGGKTAKPPKDVKVDTTIFRPATFIERSIDNLTRALMIGCALVAAVLFLVTRDWRQATISLDAIPLSLLGAGLMLLWSGATINVMIIAGLVIALGEVVDDAIIDVENIARRLRLNHEAADPKPAFAVVLAASLEVRSAVVFASLIVMLVFVPIFFLGGVAGTFFQPLAIAYVLAIGMSLLVALTVTPAMCLLLLPNTPLKAERDTRFVAAMKRRYVRFLPRVVARPAMVVGIVAGGLLLAGFGYATFKDQFLPDFREADFLMHFVERPGTSIEAMDRITIRASKELRAIPGVRSFRRAYRPRGTGRRGGRSQLHRTLDQPRRECRLRCFGRTHQGGGRGLSRPLPRRAHYRHRFASAAMRDRFARWLHTGDNFHALEGLVHLAYSQGRHSALSLIGWRPLRPPRRSGACVAH
ncbi:efflux RND transporter permease subunit [Sphingomonas yunnanensis]|uniref:efflux RND transporter permease subunit n=1 Tax=Sphingomonas yunnanensis TaxID=310400 RepID=UPI001FE3D3E6|nr:efflux RND transporter permease subunit [Sphingomonas yunnanensis]